MNSSKVNYVYILKCRDESLYTGWTNNLEKRIKDHNNNKGAKYTRGRTPCKLVYFEVYDTKSQALKREYEIKKLSRIKKLDLIKTTTIKK